MSFINIIKKHYESSTSTTPEFLKAVSQFRKELNKIFGKENVFVSKGGHFIISGFIKNNGKYVYFSTGDLRQPMRMLVRNAENTKDFQGGANNWVEYDNNFDNNFIKKIKELSN